MALVCPQRRFQWVTGGSFPNVKWRGSGGDDEFDYQLPSSAGLNEWRYSSTPPTCLHDVDGDSFTFTFLYHGHCPNKDPLHQHEVVEFTVVSLMCSAQGLSPCLPRTVGLWHCSTLTPTFWGCMWDLLGRSNTHICAAAVMVLTDVTNQQH